MTINKDYSNIKFKNDGRLKLLIIVGTRPEIIRLSAVITKCRKYFDCILAHTGQNYDYNLNGIFFKDLKLADPEVYMDAVGDDLGETVGNIIASSYKLMNQIKPEAFRELFIRFLKQFPVLKTLNGYQLVACDGSRLNLPYNPADPDSFIQCIYGRKGINQIHLNSLYDLLNDVFLDVELQGIRQMDEKGAFTRFLDKNITSVKKRIYIADRGYASYNIFAHAIHKFRDFEGDHKRYRRTDEEVSSTSPTGSEI